MGHETGARTLVQFRGNVELFDATVIHDGDAVAHGQSLILVVRDVDKGDAYAPLQLVQFDLKLLAQREVERPQRFVQQHHLRFVDDGAGKGDSLLLPAGNLRGFARGQRLDFDRSHHSFHPAIDFGGGQLSHSQSKSDIVEDVEMREQGVGLEHGIDRPLVRRHVPHVRVADADRSFVRQIESGDHAQQGGLSATGRTEQGKKFAFVDRERDAGKRFDSAESADYGVEFDGQRFNRLRIAVRDRDRLVRQLHCRRCNKPVREHHEKLFSFATKSK